MNKSIPVLTKQKSIVEPYSDDSLDVDGNATDQTPGDGKNVNDFRSCNEQQQTNLNSRDPTTSGLPFDSISLKRANSKHNFAIFFQSSNLMPIMLLIMMMMFETRCRVQGFSSFTVRSETTRIGRRQCQKCPIRNQKYQPLRRRVQSSKIGNYASVLFSSSPVVKQEEAIIPLEWIEYFSPTIEGDATTEQQQQKQQAPVLFLHGLLGSKRNFSTCANMLAVQLDKKRRIMGVDLRNHGDTQPWSDESKWKEFSVASNDAFFPVISSHMPSTF